MPILYYTKSNKIFRPSNTRIKRQVTGNRIHVDIDDFADGLTNIDVTRVVSTAAIAKCPLDENTLPCDHTSQYRLVGAFINDVMQIWTIYVTGGMFDRMGRLACLSPFPVLVLDKVRFVPI